MKDVELVTVLSKKMDMSPQKALNTLSTLYMLMANTMSDGGSIYISGLGAFEAKKRIERISVNPTNGERYRIPSKLTPVYKPSSQWKTYLKKLDDNE
jgi:nucleoid DNA-binding protein